MIVDEGVSSVDFDQVMNDGHLQGAEDVEVTAVLAQHQNAEGEIPGVFGTVFQARLVADVGATLDRFQAVGFDQEANLLFKA